MRKKSKKILKTFLVALLLIGSMLSSRSDAEWRLLPTGYTLTEDMVAGSVETARKTLEKLEIQKVTITIQDNTLKSLENEIGLISEDLAKTQLEIKLLPKRMAEENKLALTKARTQGLIFGVVAAVVIALAVGS